MFILQTLTWYDVMFVESSGSPRHLLLPKAFFIRVSLASKDLLELDHEKFSFTHVLHYKNKIPALWQQRIMAAAVPGSSMLLSTRGLRFLKPAVRTGLSICKQLCQGGRQH